MSIQVREVLLYSNRFQFFPVDCCWLQNCWQVVGLLEREQSQSAQRRSSVGLHGSSRGHSRCTSIDKFCLGRVSCLNWKQLDVVNDWWRRTRDFSSRNVAVNVKLERRGDKKSKPTVSWLWSERATRLRHQPRWVSVRH